MIIHEIKLNEHTSSGLSKSFKRNGNCPSAKNERNRRELGKFRVQGRGERQMALGIVVEKCAKGEQPHGGRVARRQRLEAGKRNQLAKDEDGRVLERPLHQLLQTGSSPFGSWSRSD